MRDFIDIIFFNDSKEGKTFDFIALGIILSGLIIGSVFVFFLERIY